MKKVFEVKQQCQLCGGTGLYVGMGERDGAAIVCHTCKGTGCQTFHHEYFEFTGRCKSESVKRVYRANPGICIGTGNGHKLEDFGGITFADWEAGASFAIGSEDRKHTCPCWWYQSADYNLKPDWKECNDALGVTFSSCPHFANKDACWKRFDDELNK